MKPQVMALDNRHITATERRGIIESIKYLHDRGALNEASKEIFIKYPRSNKEYRIVSTEKKGVFMAYIATRESNDYGAMRRNIVSHLVEIKNIDAIIGNVEKVPQPAEQGAQMAFAL